MADPKERTRVFLDVSIGTEPIGRIVVELYDDKTPRTCENFRSLCTAQNQHKLSYNLNTFHRVIDEFMVQAGDITKNDGTGGRSSFEERDFEDENLGWRDLDGEGLVCMVNRGRDTNNSQFFITLAPCDHLNGLNTIFGHVVSGMPVLEKIAKTKVDKDDRPLTDVVIARCGELQRKKKVQTGSAVPKAATGVAERENKTRIADMDVDTDNSAVSRGRDKRRHKSASASPSPSRSVSPSRGHGRESGVRHRHRRRSKQRSRSHSSASAVSAAASSRSPSASLRSASRTPPRNDTTDRQNGRKNRRRSDALPDHTFRGRASRRSESRTRSRSDSRNGSASENALGKEYRLARGRSHDGHEERTGMEQVETTRTRQSRRDKSQSRSRSKTPTTNQPNSTTRKQDRRKRSPPPSRPRSRSPDFKRQKSLPNVHRRYVEEESYRAKDGRRRDDDQSYGQNRGRREHNDDYDGAGYSDRRDNDGGRFYGRERGERGYGRLGGGGGGDKRYRGDGGGRLGGGGGYFHDDDDNDNATQDGIVYKGRGSMKYREHGGGGGGGGGGGFGQRRW